MPKPPLPPELDQFLVQSNPSVIATLRGDGSPHTAAYADIDSGVVVAVMRNRFSADMRTVARIVQNRRAVLDLHRPSRRSTPRHAARRGLARWRNPLLHRPRGAEGDQPARQLERDSHHRMQPMGRRAGRCGRGQRCPSDRRRGAPTPRGRVGQEMGRPMATRRSRWRRSPRTRWRGARVLGSANQSPRVRQRQLQPHASPLPPASPMTLSPLTRLSD
jgi:hypothetical protein